MLKNLFLTLTAGAFAAGVFVASPIATSVARADQSNSKVITIPVNPTTPASGKAMYANYCAACHGANGKGDGPVASALKKQPADLTLLSRNNGGRFPVAHVKSIIQFGTDVPSHGNSEMPVWGPFLGKMDHVDSSSRPLRISNLSRYLETIQAK